MGKELFASEPAFRSSIERCDKEIKKIANWSLIEEMHRPQDKSRLEDMDISQPYLVAVYIALSNLYQSWGIFPDTVIGASVGEIAAAYASGRLSISDAFLIVCRRSALMKRVSGKGSMAFIGLNRMESEKLLLRFQNVSIAAINSPKSMLVAGDTAEIHQILKELESKNIYCKLVRVNIASHCSQMDGILSELGADLADLKPKSGMIPMYSTTCGRALDEGEKLDAQYWVSNLRRPVLFSDGVQSLIGKGVTTFVEVSPHPVLWKSICDGVDAAGVEKVRSLFSMQREISEKRSVYAIAAALFVDGYQVSWESLIPRTRVCSLPARQWRNTHFWFTSAGASAKRTITGGMPFEPPWAEAPETGQKGARGRLKAEIGKTPQAERLLAAKRFIDAQLVKFVQPEVLQSASSNATFKDIGLSSIAAVEIRNQLAVAMDAKLPASLLFDFPTRPQLAEHILELPVDPKDDPRNIGSILLSQRKITEDQLRKAVDYQQTLQNHERLGSILMRSGHLKMEDLHRALVEQSVEPIAIIGMGCRLPGGINNTDAYWELLQNGRNAIQEVPPDRWDIEKYYDADDDELPGKIRSRFGGFVDCVDKFDAAFFGINQREAIAMDPQQRFMLEVAWEAIENAGMNPRKLFGSKTGVFVGAMNGNDYAELKHPQERREEIHPYDATGNALSVLAGRLSYVLGLEGPAVTIDTACSSSLVATHLACQSLRLGESGLAIAGGVNLILSPTASIAFSAARMLSPDGQCRTFDSAANGYVRSEGCAVVVLKRLSDALRDGDSVLAVINGSAINQDGHSNGLTAPNGKAQEKVIGEALASCGVHPSHVQYVEAHGTGTQLGDPIEALALASVYCNRINRTNKLIVGSVKTNIGHLEAAAGIGGLIKVVLSLRKGAIPPNLNFTCPNPLIPLDELSMEVPTQLKTWEGFEFPRTAGLSSFGFSGTNAHMIISEAPVRKDEKFKTDSFEILTVSARSGKALSELAESYVHCLSEQDQDASFLHDFCYTANDGRANFDFRAAIIGEDQEDIVRQLLELAKSNQQSKVVRELGDPSRPNPLTFIFSGQNLHDRGMGQDLYKTYPVFREALNQCADLFKPHLDMPLLKVMFGERGCEGNLNEDCYSQPALFAFEYSTYQLWKAFGIEPMTVMGAGIGGIVAACVAGVFTLDDCVKLIAKRAKLMEKVSGFQSISAQMESMLDDFEQFAGQLQYSSPARNLVSNLSGDSLTLDEMKEPNYWRQHILNAVSYDEGIRRIYEKGCRIFVEIGPESKLMVSEKNYLVDAICLNGFTNHQPESKQILDTLGVLFAQGASINWSAFYTRNKSRRKIQIPTYPFQRKRYWLDLSPESSLSVTQRKKTA